MNLQSAVGEHFVRTMWTRVVFLVHVSDAYMRRQLRRTQKGFATLRANVGFHAVVGQHVGTESFFVGEFPAARGALERLPLLMDGEDVFPQRSGLFENVPAYFASRVGFLEMNETLFPRSELLFANEAFEEDTLTFVGRFTSS